MVETFPKKNLPNLEVGHINVLKLQKHCAKNLFKKTYLQEFCGEKCSKMGGRFKNLQTSSDLHQAFAQFLVCRVTRYKSTRTILNT